MDIRSKARRKKPRAKGADEGLLRAYTSPVDRWCDKTMSVLREQQLEACQDRLSRAPREGVFGPLCQDEIDRLFSLSFYAREMRQRVPSLADLRARVLLYASREALCLSPREDALVKRMLSCRVGCSKLSETAHRAIC